MSDQSILSNVKSWSEKQKGQTTMHIKHLPWCERTMVVPVEAMCSCDEDGTALSQFKRTLNEKNELSGRVSQLEALVIQLRSPLPCRFDGHGFCVTHGWISKERCPHAKALEVK